MRTFLIATAVLITATVLSTPRITGVAPNPIGPSPTSRVLTVSGEGFMAGLSLMVTTPGGGSRVFQDADIQQRRESSFQVSMVLATAGTYSLVVTNSDGGMSAPFQLKVAAAATGAPVINSVTPARTTAQPGAQALRVDGKLFAQGLTVYVTDPTGQVAIVSGNDVTDVTPSGFRVSVVLGMEGQYTLDVKNPDGGTSNSFSVTVTKMR